MPSKKQSIVIVGGGSAGAAIARPLSKSLNPALHDLVLINERPYTIPLPPTLRLVASSKNDIQEKTFLPYDKLFINGNGRFVHGEVVGVDTEKKEVQLKDGQSVAYDVLVLATGSIWEGPIGFPQDPSEVEAFIEQKRHEFAKAEDILLVGGGAVGIGTFLVVFSRKSSSDHSFQNSPVNSETLTPRRESQSSTVILFF